MADSHSDCDPVEQLAASFLARFRAGERPSLTEIAAAHPELADEIRALFPALLELEQAGSAIGPEPGPAAPRASGGGLPLESLGDYRIIREVGRGGMGVVYEAVQESLGRHVALKVFAPWARAGPKQIERFRREACAAARLHHTNIVPVFGVGEHSSHHYYAMQFIQGQGLDRILEELRRLRLAPEPAGAGPPDPTAPALLAASVAHSLLTGRFATRASVGGTATTVKETYAGEFERAEAPRAPAATGPSTDASIWASQTFTSYARTIARVGLQVADALAHAHGQGILHRDIKPSNLLLDIEGNVWVTDFGLAKDADADGLTDPGNVVGTVRYMAPERFRGHSDPESDVYGLGVTLYELLTLRPAFDESDRARLIDHILHASPPPPRSLDPRIPRDLETIVLKAMAQHPADRYSSARALAEDLGRFRDDRTILARRSSASERLWRWCKRNPALTALGGLAATLTTAIAIISTVAAFWLGQSRNKALENLGRAWTAEAQARAEAEHARRSAAESEAVRKFLEDDLLSAARPEGQEGGLGKHATIRQAVDAARPRIASAFQHEPVIEAAVRNTLGLTYLYLGEPDEAIHQHERARALREDKLGPDHPETLTTRNNLALAYQEVGRTAEAIKLFEATLKQRESKLGPDHPDTLTSRNNLAAIYHAAGRNDDAIKMQEATLKERESKLGPDDPNTLISRTNLANAYRAAGRTDDAIKMHEATLKLFEAKLGPDHPDTLNSRNSLAVAYRADNRTDDAIKMHEATLKLFESKLGPDHPDTLINRTNLANAYRAAGRTDDAIKMHEATLKLFESKLGPDHRNTLITRNSLAQDYQAAGRTDDAIKLFEATLKQMGSKLGPDHPDTLNSRNSLAQAYRAAGRTHDAIKMYEGTLKQMESKLGPDHPNTLATRNNLAAAYWEVGTLDRSVPLFETLLKQRESKLGPDHPDTLRTLANLGINYRDAGRLDDGIRLMEQAFDRAQARYGTIPPSLAWAEGQLAVALDRAKRFDKSEPLYRNALERARKQFGPADPRTAGAMTKIGMSLIQQRKWAEAEPLLRQALAIRQKVQPDDWSTFNTRSQLGGSLLCQGKFAEAEPLIRSGYDGLKARQTKIPAAGKPSLAEAAERVVRLYESWGKPDQAKAWAAKLGQADLPADAFAGP